MKKHAVGVTKITGTSHLKQIKYTITVLYNY